MIRRSLARYERGLNSSLQQPTERLPELFFFLNCVRKTAIASQLTTQFQIDGGAEIRSVVDISPFAHFSGQIESARKNCCRR